MTKGWRGHGLRIVLAAAFGGCVGLAASRFATAEVAVALGWDAAAIAYAGRIWLALSAVRPEELETWSAEEDDGRWAITLILTTAAAASFAAIFAMVSDTSGAATRALAAFTILCSWTLLHTAYAAHYAHRCFADGADRPGLDFPGDDKPGFLDFAYYAFTVGMTFQVSDVTTRSRAMRRLTLAHAMVSFAFNTVIIAISVSVASGLL